ncbi:CCNA2 [Bugula neritina]|uniref:CCNA2 n=1 Tax=Bugula neritina TaxID=10212 RepID=A0A7J7K920_BUGNE|nr:CCNA2 [Bugula neritina]
MQRGIQAGLNLLKFKRCGQTQTADIWLLRLVRFSIISNCVAIVESYPSLAELAASLREFVSTKENMNSFQVYTDENQGVQTRAKRADGQAAQKRTHLVSSPTCGSNPHVQLSLTVSWYLQSAPFKVYEDTGRVSAPKDDEKRLKLVRKAPAPAPVFHPSDGYLEKLVEDITADSPMALDISCMDTDDSVRPVVDTATSSVDRETSLYCLPEYRDDIIEYLKEAETRCRPKVSYMRKQTDISPQMRTILVDWLVEVCEEYKLHDETLHLAVNYIDRFLSQIKFEEIYPPDVGEFVYITDDTYTKRQLLRMEHLVIKCWGLSAPSPQQMSSQIYIFRSSETMNWPDIWCST